MIQISPHSITLYSRKMLTVRLSQLVFTSSKLTIETVERGVQYVQS